MKRLLTKTAILLMVTSFGILSSCSDDDNNTTTAKTSIEYRIEVPQPILTQVSYTDTDGTVKIDNGPFTGLETWSKTEDVTKPFNAQYNAKFFNTTSDVVVFYMYIYADGKLVKSATGEAPPQMEVTGTIAYGLLNN